jgi:glycosyltransferase involved in cell wall biosynthesis
LWSDPMHRKVFPKWMFNTGVRMERALARRCDAVMTASPGYSREMAKNMGIPAPAVIRNLPASSEVLASLGAGRTSGDQSRPLRSDLGLDATVPLILHLGQMGAGRGLETFLGAMVEVAPPAVAVFLGGGAFAYRERLRSLAEGLGIGQRVFFHDPVPPVDIYRYASSATIGVALIESACLSYRYTLPNKSFEYLHAGLPVVASDIPEMAAIVRDYKVGEIFHEGDSRELADVINKLLASPELLAYYRQMSLLATQELTWSKESPRLVNIYERLFSGELSSDRSMKISSSATGNSRGY